MNPTNPFPETPDFIETVEAVLDFQETPENDASPEDILPIPIPLAKQPVSGRYRGTLGTFQLELRVDVDSTRPTNMVSGDFYTVSGGVTSYFGSFKGAVTSVWTTSLATIKGTMTTSWATPYNRVTITIPRRTIIQLPAAATLTFYNAAMSPGATYICPFESRSFRTLKLEVDTETGITAFGSYNTNLLPHGGTGRILNAVSAYSEAGVQMVTKPGATIVPTNAAGANAIWTNAELEAAMHTHFSIVSDTAKWQTYLLACKSKHEMTTGGSTLFGIMFDYTGAVQRQGCAVFHTQVNSFYGGAGSNTANRNMLYTYVHELGHSFNLLHSWNKSRPNALSWMNYPSSYDQANGAGSFWANFAFQFDIQELQHLRHAYRNHVIQGGDNWAVNAGYIEDGHETGMPEVLENQSGLALELQSKPTYLLGEPVVVEIKLNLRDLNGKRVNAALHPNFDFTRIAIKKPGGEIVNYEGLAHHLIETEPVNLTETNPAIYESAYIGYGKGGFYFDAPGVYSIKGAYRTAEGAIITSAEIKIRVKSPVTADDDAIADLYMGEEQGQLFYLLGSDAAHLKNGNEAFDTVLAQYPNHPLSAYAALVQGVNAARDFKTIAGDKKIKTRKRNVKKSQELSSKLFRMTSQNEGVDNITLNYALRKTAEAQLKSGDKNAAEKTLSDMRSFFEGQNLRPTVITRIDTQIAQVLNTNPED